jgi:hypothetical protein
VRTMYDSTNPADIPADAQLVGFYVDGIYAVAPPRARFPNAVLVPISAVGTNAGLVGDVEPGCIWPLEAAVPWVQARRAAGADPSLYVNQKDWPTLRRIIQGAAIVEPHYWVADWRSYPDPTIPQDAVARQFGGSAQTGKHYDISSVADHWPGVDTMGITDAQAIERTYNIEMDGLHTGGDATSAGYLKRVIEPMIDGISKQIVPVIDATGPNPSPIDSRLVTIQNTLIALSGQLATIEQLLRAPDTDTTAGGGGGITEAQLAAALKALVLKAA